VRRHALVLWFLGLAALGLLRFWMKWKEAAGATLAFDAWLWLAGAGACAAAAAVAWLRARR
jgi:hypothetical protein